MPAAGLTVRHARLTGARADDRERLIAALDRVSLPALGLPSRGTLVLGRVVAPAPLALDRSPEGFVRQLEESLRRRAAHARRGRAGTGDGDWLFEDEAELDIALVAAWRERGTTASALLQTVTGTVTPDLRMRWRRSIFTDGGRAILAVSRLAEVGLAAFWLAGFEASELEAAAERIHARHADGPARRMRPSPLPKEATTPAVASPGPTTAQRILARTLAALAPEALAMPAKSAARQLTLTALVARRRPALLSLPGFTAGAEFVLSGVTPASATRAPGRGPVAAVVPIAPEAGPVRLAPPGPPANGRSQPAEPSDPPAKSLPTIPSAAMSTPGNCLEGTAAPVAHASDFAGMAFLLNAFVALGLWGDFTRPRDGLPGLSPFELLLLLGRHWYGSRFAADPSHGVLRELAGLRRGEPPGRHFAAPPWTVPEHWVTPWGASRSHRPNWHHAGFPLADRRYADRSEASRRRYWLSALARYLGARLAAALALDDASAARDCVCRRRGEIILERDMLCFRFALSHHPLAIRLAGLDRDPGRLAGTDRPVKFEFTA